MVNAPTVPEIKIKGRHGISRRRKPRTNSTSAARISGTQHASAIDAYMHSGGHAITDILKAKNRGELSEREMNINTLVANGRDSLDQLRSALQD